MHGTTARSPTVYTQGVGTSTFAYNVPETPKSPIRITKRCIVVAVTTTNQNHWLESSSSPAHLATATTLIEHPKTDAYWPCCVLVLFVYRYFCITMLHRNQPVLCINPGPGQHWMAHSSAFLYKRTVHGGCCSWL